MTPKEYLSQLRGIDIGIASKLDEVARLRSLAEKCTVSFGGAPGGSGNGGDRIPRMVEKINELEQEINCDIDNLVDKKREIHAVIADVEDQVLREILVRRYIKYQKWELIAVEMDRDLRWIYRLHGKALQKIKIDH